MFAGGRRRSSNVRAMQLFHELKQQFPTVPDHIVTACIAANSAANSPDEKNHHDILEVLEVAASQQNPQGQQELMGLTPAELIADSAAARQQLPESSRRVAEDIFHSQGIEEEPHPQPPTRAEMSENDVNQNAVLPNARYSKKDESVSVHSPDCDPQQLVGKSTFFVKRPTHLDINPPETTDKPTRKDVYNANNPRLRPSERCKDVHKLLNSEKLNEKPPRSPSSSAKRLSNASANKNSPVKTAPGKPLPEAAAVNSSAEEDLVVVPTTSRRNSAEKPTQTTDTLIGGGVNLSLNVNCSMDVVQSPTRPRRRSSVIQLTPEQPWLQEPSSPRSYTSVNLTLRPPSSQPQAPIDITSQNSSLTYSTSTFDSQKGLQSRLQITVGPGGGSVSSLRTRPRSSYHPIEEGATEMVPTRAESLPDLAADNEPPVVIKQQARIERLRIELNTEKAKLVVMKQDVAELENNQNLANLKRTDEELEKQLVREIQHLNCQCERLETEVSQISRGFYQNIYTGQTLDLPSLPVQRPTTRGRLQYQGPTSLPQPEAEGPKWNCHMCTFQNHPALNKCEQCDMPRILHGTPTNTPPVNAPNWGYAGGNATAQSPYAVRPPNTSQLAAVNLTRPNRAPPGFFNSMLRPGANTAYTVVPQSHLHPGRYLRENSERVSQI